MRLRRFAEVMQFDYIHRGSDLQREAVIEALTPIYGTPHHRLLQRLDRAVNAAGRSYLTVGFRSGMTAPGQASPAGFNLSAAMGWAGCFEVARHEFGHLVDFWLLTDDNRNWFMAEMGRATWPGAWESWATAVAEWLGGGWQALTPILLPEGGL